MRVTSTVNKQDLKWVDEYSLEEADIYKFYCPVCLRYFNHILTSNCCNNYICRFCIGDMAKRAKFANNYVIRCTHCYKDEFLLTDADESLKPREYTDTPAKVRRHIKSSTFKI